MPVVLHPDAALERKLVLPNGFEVRLPAPRLDDLAAEGVDMIEGVAPSLLVEDMVLVSGEVPQRRSSRRASARTGRYGKASGKSDAQILDDQCAILRLAGKGLVVLTGFSHAGIINTVRQAVALTGAPTYTRSSAGSTSAGGFEPIIPQTVAALSRLSPTSSFPGTARGSTPKWPSRKRCRRRSCPAALAPPSGCDRKPTVGFLQRRERNDGSGLLMRLVVTALFV